MSDIVERLRLLASIDNCQASIEAADEIERLRAALEEIAKYEIKEGCPCNACGHSAIARAALGFTPVPTQGGDQ